MFCFRSRVPPLDPPILEMPLWTLGARLRMRCVCGRAVDLPLRMQPRHLEDLLMAELLGRFRCRGCGERPAEAFYADRGDTFVGGGVGVGRRIWLIR